MRGARVVVMVGAVLACGAASAQPLKVPPGRWWERPQVAQRIGLSDEQREKLNQVTVEQARRMVDLKAAVERAELEVRIAAEGEPFDAATLRKAFAQLQQARARLEVERFELLVAQRELLSAEQWEKLRNLAREFVERRQEGRDDVGAPRAPRRPEPGRRF